MGRALPQQLAALVLEAGPDERRGAARAHPVGAEARRGAPPSRRASRTLSLAQARAALCIRTHVMRRPNATQPPRQAPASKPHPASKPQLVAPTPLPRRATGDAPVEAPRSVAGDGKVEAPHVAHGPDRGHAAEREAAPVPGGLDPLAQVGFVPRQPSAQRPRPKSDTPVATQHYDG